MRRHKLRQPIHIIQRYDLAKLFFRWVVERGYLRTSPFEKVKAVGKAHAGKLQLRIDEARKLTQVLVQAGQAGEEGAIAAFCQLVLGLRTSEVLERQVRDLDDDGYVLWIPSGKNDNSAGSSYRVST